MVKTRKQLAQEKMEAAQLECREGVFGVNDVTVMDGLNPVYIDRELLVGDKPRLKVNYTKDTDVYDRLFIENAVEIPTEVLKSVIAQTDELSEDLSDVMLKTLLPQALAFDQASAYVEATARDGLKTNVTIEDDVLSGVSPLSRLSIIYRYLRRLRLPGSIKKHIMLKLADDAVEDSTKAMNTKSNSRKYSQKLRELTGVVRGNGTGEHRTDAAFLRRRSPNRSDK